MGEMPRIGRCQRCGQVRPVFPHDGKAWDGTSVWDPPLPEFLGPHVWLCVRDHSRATLAGEMGDPFHVEHYLEVEFWRDEKDLRICEATLAATEEEETLW